MMEMGGVAGMTPGPALPYFNYAKEGPNGEMVIPAGGGFGQSLFNHPLL